jgi:hypothetical protein
MKAQIRIAYGMLAAVFALGLALPLSAQQGATTDIGTLDN